MSHLHLNCIFLHYVSSVFLFDKSIHSPTIHLLKRIHVETLFKPEWVVVAVSIKVLCRCGLKEPYSGRIQTNSCIEEIKTKTAQRLFSFLYIIFDKILILFSFHCNLVRNLEGLPFHVCIGVIFIICELLYTIFKWSNYILYMKSLRLCMVITH